MDGFSDEYSETWPTWGIMRDGVCIRPHGLAPRIDESEFLLLPTMTKWAGKSYLPETAKKVITGTKQRKSGSKIGSELSWEPSFYNFFGVNNANTLNPLLIEMLMGFPMLWTETNASGTQ